jgi:hypothetical protein
VRYRTKCKSKGLGIGFGIWHMATNQEDSSPSAVDFQPGQTSTSHSHDATGQSAKARGWGLAAAQHCRAGRSCVSSWEWEVLVWPG